MKQETTAPIAQQEQERLTYEEFCNLKKYSWTLADSNISVCNHTSEWIAIYRKAQSLFSEIYDIVYCEEYTSVDARFEKEFEPHLLALFTAIEAGVSKSVITSIQDDPQTTII